MSVALPSQKANVNTQRSLARWRARGAICWAERGARDSKIATWWLRTQQQIIAFWSQLTSWPVATVQPWRIALGGIAVLIPAFLLSLLYPTMPVTTPGVVLVIAVAFSTYLADWVGGVTALLLSALLLDLLFIGDHQQINLSIPRDAIETSGFIITLAAGAGLIWLIERIKREGADQRFAAVTARAAANALSSLEQIATSAGTGEQRYDERLSRSIVNAMVRVNRAHAGVLLLVDSDSGDWKLSASYGLSVHEEYTLRTLSEECRLTNLIARERRSYSIEDIQADDRFSSSPLRQTKLRAILGVPLIDEHERLQGIALIGLLVHHRFTALDIVRVEALAERASRLLQAAAVANEREMLLQRAREAERRLELVVAAMPEAVVITTPPSGHIIGYNSAAENLFGSLEEANGFSDLASHLQPLQHDMPDTDIKHFPHITALQTGLVIEGVELAALHIDGSVTPVLASAAPIRESDGTLAAVVTVFRNIAALKEAARLKDEFLSVVSHELRSPLTPIRGFVQLVAKDLDRIGGHETHIRWLTSVEDQIDRMTRLVDDLLDVSRLRSGGLEIRRAPMDLVALCRTVLDVRTNSTTDHELRLQTDLHVLRGNWDKDRLHQVIENLVGNAIKYSPAGSTVTVAISTEQTSGDAVITVSDEGPGISADERSQIFGPFFRTRTASASHVHGLGLGLYICHELVLAHDGEIIVGENPGGGAAFTVRLPRGQFIEDDPNSIIDSSLVSVVISDSPATPIRLVAQMRKKKLN